MLETLICITVYRVTRLLVRDSFPPIEEARQRVTDRWGPNSWQAYLSSCPWCMSVWVGGILTAVVAATVGVPVPLLVWPATSAVTGFLSAIEPDQE